MLPYFPLGFGRVNDPVLAYGLRGTDKAYLSVFAIGRNTAELPLACLKQPVTGARVIYPASEDCEYRLENGVLKVTLPDKPCARLFELSLG